MSKKPIFLSSERINLRREHDPNPFPELDPWVPKKMTTSGNRRFFFVAIWGFGLYTSICVGVFLFQRSLLYFPTDSPRSTRLVPWVNDGQTIGYCHETPSPNAVWLMMHGNAGQASDRDYVLEHLADHEALYVLEYPGYGKRDGSPSKSSIDAATQEAYRILRSRYPNTPVCVIGESLGSGPASRLATSQPPPAKIVLITPFDSMVRVASEKFFFLPVWLLLLDRWDNTESLQGFQGNIDIYAAEADEVIPILHAKALSETSPNIRFHVLPGGHNDWSSCDRVTISQ